MAESEPEPRAVRDHRRSSYGPEYWIRRCEGFLVETRTKRIGRVAGIRYGKSQDDPEALGRAGIELLHLPTPDRYGFTYAQMEHGVTWVVDHLAHGGRAFLHCEHGVGRGPLMTCAVLVAQGYNAPDALRLVRSARWQALPNDRQLAALVDFEEHWRAQHARVRVPDG